MYNVLKAQNRKVGTWKYTLKWEKLENTSRYTEKQFWKDWDFEDILKNKEHLKYYECGMSKPPAPPPPPPLLSTISYFLGTTGNYNCMILSVWEGYKVSKLSTNY